MQVYVSVMSTKGQVVVPSSVRQTLDLQEGSQVEFSVEPDGRVLITKKLTAEERTAARAKAIADFWLAMDDYNEEHVWKDIDGEDFVDPPT